MFLEIRGLRSGYREGTVLHGVDLDLDRGRTLGLLGRNGAGKSTLVMTIMGLLPATAGSVRLAGVELIGRRPHEIARAGVAVVPQGRRIWPGLTVDEHLALGARGPRAAAAASPRWTAASIVELLPQLAGRRRQPAGLLSGGEQQMLAVARILRTGARLLLLDEISEGLAPVIVQKLGAVVKSLREQGYTIVMVEQNFRFAAPLADRFLVMEHGQVIQQFTQAELPARMERLHEYLGV